MHAYEDYLKQRSHMRGSDGDSLEVARALYARARVLAQLAICESYFAIGRSSSAGTGDKKLHLDHAHRVLRLDAYLADGHAAVGLSLYAAGRYVNADKSRDGNSA